MTDRPAATSNRPLRRSAAPAKISTTAAPMKRALPYVVSVAVVAALALVLRTPAIAHYGAIGAGVVVFGVMAWMALSHRVSLKTDDGLRTAVLVSSVLIFVCALAPFVRTVLPPAPAGTLRLARQGDEQSLRIDGAANSVWLTVRAAYAPNAGGAANYFLSVRRDEGPVERLNGALRVQPDRYGRDRLELASRGAGTYRVRLEEYSPAVLAPVEVSLTPRPISTLLLALVYAALAFGAVAIDALLARRGLEPSFAAASLLPLGAVLYFQRHPPSDALLTELAAAGAVGIGAALGGELLARLGRMVSPR